MLLGVYSAALATFAVVVGRYLGSPLRFDEVAWPPQAMAILRHGAPRVAYSESTQRFAPPFGVSDAIYGMWHPPTYLYSLAFASAGFGTSSLVLRVTGLVWFVLTLAVAWKLIGLLYPELSPLFRALPIALILLTPLLNQGSMFLDIDNTSLGFFLLLFLYKFLRQPESLAPSRLLLLSFVFTLALWSKLTTPWMALAAIAAFHILNGRVRTALLQTAAIAAMSGIAFGLTYLAYCNLLHYPWRYMLEFTYLGKQAQYTRSNSIVAALHSLRWQVVWVSPAITLVVLWTVFRRVRNYFSTRTAEGADVIIIYAVVGLGLYDIWSGVVGKYTDPLVLAVMLVAGGELGRTLRSAKFTHPLRFLGLTGLLAVVVTVAMNPLEGRPAGLAYQSAGLLRDVFHPTNVAIAAIFVAFALYYLVGRNLDVMPAASLLAVCLVSFAAVVNLADTVKLASSPDDRSPYWATRDRGFDDLVSYLRQNTASTDLILAPKDIGYYVNVPHFETDGYDAQTNRELAGAPSVRYIVDSINYPTFDQSALASSGRVMRRRVGTYVIYE